MKFITKKDFDVIPIEKVSVHKDPKVLSGLFVLLNKTMEHDKQLTDMSSKITTLIDSINNYLNNK